MEDGWEDERHHNDEYPFDVPEERRTAQKKKGTKNLETSKI
jgi:hypothetical protein